MRQIKIPIGNRIYYVGINIIVGLFALFCFIPFWVVIAGSITDENTILRKGYELIPDKLSLDAYIMLLTGDRLWKSYIITIIVTVCGTFLSLLVTAMLAYAISNRGMRHRNKIAFFVYFTMLFSGGLVPWYILITQYLKLGDKIWVLFLPYMVNAFNCLLLRNFFKTIPESLMESAKIDGANDATTFFRIVLPLSKAGLATIGLFYSLFYWNDFFTGVLFINKQDLFPLSLLLRALTDNLTATAAGLNPQYAASFVKTPPAYGVRMATCLVTIGPIVLVYPFIQKYFIKGITVGAVKG